MKAKKIDHICIAVKDLEKAKKISETTYTIDEFLYDESQEGKISSENFQEASTRIILHTHCYQKVLSDSKYTEHILKLVPGAEVKLIKSGCCGMAGSFGYEKEHYELSLKIANLSVVPEIKASPEEKTVIAAPGTSCREQIVHTTKRVALHPVEILNYYAK